MNTNDLIMAHLCKLIYDLTYYEHIVAWCDALDISSKIKALNIQIKATCDVMNIIGRDNFWVHENGIKGYNGKYIDVKSRFGLFKEV